MFNRRWAEFNKQEMSKTWSSMSLAYVAFGNVLGSSCASCRMISRTLIRFTPNKNVRLINSVTVAREIRGWEIEKVPRSNFCINIGRFFTYNKVDSHCSHLWTEPIETNESESRKRFPYVWINVIILKNKHISCENNVIPDPFQEQHSVVNHYMNHPCNKD